MRGGCAFLLLALCASATALDVRVSFQEDGVAVIGKRKMDLDGRGGFAYGSATNDSDWRAGDVELALQSFTFPVVYPYAAEQLAPYAVQLIADASSPTAGGGSLRVEGGCDARIELRTRLRFLHKNRTLAEIPLPLTLAAPRDGGCIDDGGFLLLQASNLTVPRLPLQPAANAFFGLPTRSARFEFRARVDFPDGWPGSRCGAAQRRPGEVFFSVGRSKLGIGGGGLPPFQFDPAIGHLNASGGTGTLGPVTGGKASFEMPVEDVHIASLDIIPSMFNLSIDVPAARVDIRLQRALTGTLNFCTGEVQMVFNASFVPVVLNHSSPALPVVTMLTTGTSTGYSHTRTGVRFNRWGDGEVVGVSKVPKSASVFENLLLSLPSDAITEMPAHFSVGCVGWGLAKRMFCGDEH